MEVIGINKDKNLQATEVASAATREELDVWMATGRMRNLEEDSKDAEIGKAEKKKHAEAHIDRLKTDIGKKAEVEGTRIRVGEIKRKLETKRFLLMEKEVRDEKEEEKLNEASKLLEIATAKEKRAEESVRAREKVVDRRKKKWTS